MIAASVAGGFSGPGGPGGLNGTTASVVLGAAVWSGPPDEPGVGVEYSDCPGSLLSEPAGAVTPDDAAPVEVSRILGAAEVPAVGRPLDAGRETSSSVA